MSNTLAHVFRAARERVGMTQSALAEEVGIAPNHVARLESGAKAAPRFDTVARIAVALGLSLDQIAVECGYRIAKEEHMADTASAIRLARKLRSVAAQLQQLLGDLKKNAEQLERHAGSRPTKTRSSRNA